MLSITGNYTDLYQISMAQVYFHQQQSQSAVFDYFFRKNPYQGGYTLFAGLDTLLGIIEQLQFSQQDLQFLSEQGFKADFLNYLENFRFNGTIYSCREGDLVFPNAPVLSVKANLIEAQLIETVLLNTLNFQTLIASKAARIRSVAKDATLLDFGLRRAQGAGGYYASRAAIVGGFNGTSHVKAGQDFGLSVAGTMAHSFVQSHDDELTAFRNFAKDQPNNTVLLVDTYDTLKSGVPNAITVGQEMAARGQQLKAIRLDSGDLAYLSKQSRQMLDQAGLHKVKIAASNQLDEHVIKSLLEQQAPIDVFGVGTSLVIGRPDGALDGVYKLAYFNGKPRIKLSENIKKMTLPGHKQVFRMTDSEGRLIGADVIGLADEDAPTAMQHPYEPFKSLDLSGLSAKPMLAQVMHKGQRLDDSVTLTDIAKYAQTQMALLADDYRRFDNPHQYKVGISVTLKQQRDELIKDLRTTR
ncbi:nicotinate phosphoribosyltransferase [Marinicella gelatinilytica]|uniref:nicotinate phosphoribosyltransferase n=1 Tax=Marinicella gelatinilytica TaxID=2996017 RepID=UPI002260CBD8|nr:nicotinate phosphoribosyltransferase [Marinicella gelatinilytica]MCX7546000.1 nicotinate phosphoribosyltransferase [Marinicella gelatinilytica]